MLYCPVPDLNATADGTVPCAAVPDFAMGAMENWGLITFRETALLVDVASAPARTLQHVAYVVSHELAHQALS